MERLNTFSDIQVSDIQKAAEQFQTPFYLYDEKLIRERCQMALAMPNGYGIDVRYAMKANSNKALLQIIDSEGVCFDASSLNEVKRAKLAGISVDRILLTTQEVPEGQERADLEQLILEGLSYNICSLRQLHMIGDFAEEHKIPLSIRMHPGIGAGESASRNTGDEYSCFGVHLSDLDQVLQYAKQKGIIFERVHTHIGSGGDPEIWRQNIDLELGFVNDYFPDAVVVNFGGGLKEARMPGEIAADIGQLGAYTKQQIEAFCRNTGRKLKMEIEPGTFIMANSGYAVTKVLDKKQTGATGFKFVILDGGMDINARPLLYGSTHPFYVISSKGTLLSSDFLPETTRDSDYEGLLVGRCCESGDSQSLDSNGNIIPRKMAQPEIGDVIVIGGTGAYCAAMTPFNYNSHIQAAEVLLRPDGELKLIRKQQTLDQVVMNEISIDV